MIFKRIWLFLFGIKDIQTFKVPDTIPDNDLCVHIPHYGTINETINEDGSIEYKMYGHIRSVGHEYNGSNKILYVRVFRIIKNKK